MEPDRGFCVQNDSAVWNMRLVMAKSLGVVGITFCDALGFICKVGDATRFCCIRFFALCVRVLFFVFEYIFVVKLAAISYKLSRWRGGVDRREA